MGLEATLVNREKRIALSDIRIGEGGAVTIIGDNSCIDAVVEKVIHEDNKFYLFIYGEAKPTQDNDIWFEHYNDGYLDGFLSATRAIEERIRGLRVNLPLPVKERLKGIEDEY